MFVVIIQPALHGLNDWTCTRVCARVRVQCAFEVYTNSNNIGHTRPQTRLNVSACRIYCIVVVVDVVVDVRTRYHTLLLTPRTSTRDCLTHTAAATHQCMMFILRRRGSCVRGPAGGTTRQFCTRVVSDRRRRCIVVVVNGEI